MSTENEKMTVTGLEQAENRKEAEYDLVSALLEATEYQTDEDNIVEAEIKRKIFNEETQKDEWKFFFSVRLHPISEPDVRKCRKASTSYMKNPNGKNLPPIEKDFDSVKFNSLLIYTATVPEDQQSIWGNKKVMEKFDFMEAWETIDKLLTVGEKRRLSDLVMQISGLDDDEDETMDQETFQ